MKPIFKGARGYRFSLCFLSAFFLLAPPLFATANQFVYLPSSSPAGFTYGVGSGVTFNVQAVTIQGGPTTVLDGAFNQAVTVGVYDTATSQLSDPGAIIVSGGTTYACPAVLSFSGGNLGFGVTFKSGSDSEQVSIYNSAITTGSTYPGSIGVTAGPGFIVQGFPATFFAQDTNYDSIPAPYPTGDLLVTDPVAANLYSSDLGVTIPPASGVTDLNSGIDTAAASYAITQLSGGYAFGGLGISPHLRFQKNTVAAASVTYAIILDYDGTLADYNSPRPGKDTVFVGNVAVGATTLSGNYTTATGGTTIAGFQPFKPFMTGGQIIIRAWNGTPANGVNMKYLDSSGLPNNLSSVVVPYSSQNVRPLQAIITPKIVVDGSVSTLTYVLNNQYASPVSYVSLLVPPNSPASGQYWGISIISNPLTGYPSSSVAVASQPSGSSPGTITVDMGGGALIPVNQSVTLSMSATVSGQSGSWPISILQAKTGPGLIVPSDSSQAVIQTLGIPNTPGNFTGTPANFASPGTGGQINLTWNVPVTTEGATQYVLTRAPGGAGWPQTINGIGTTSASDGTVTNLLGYTYTIVAQNSVTHSLAASVGPVTPFVNPNPPGPVAALTGGTSIQLNWTAATVPAGGYPIAGYQIYRGTASGAENSVPIATVGPGFIQYNDPGASSAGTTYFYYLSTIDNQYGSGPTMGPHDSGPSVEVSGNPPGNSPNSFTPSLVNSAPPTIGLGWTAPANNLNSPVSYLVYKSDTTTLSPYSAMVTVNNATVTVMDGTGLVSGHIYGYYVVSLDNLGYTSNAITIFQGVGPSTVTGLVATASTSSMALTWGPNPALQLVVNYVVYRDGSLLAATAGVTGYTDNGLSYGVDHSYTVAAVNNAGVTGPFSPPVTSARLPNAPTIGTASFLPGSDSVSINWSDPDTNLLNFIIYPFINGPVTTGIVPPFGVFNYTEPFTPADAGSTVIYELRANNIGGLGPTLSASVGLQIPPQRPTGVTASSTTNTITVNWLGNTGSDKVSNYSVYRSQLPVGPSTVLQGTVPFGTNTFNDLTATAGVTYFYNVTATNPGGGIGIPGGEGLPSNPVTVGLAPPAVASFGVTAAANPRSNVIISWTPPVPSGGVTGYAIYSNTINAQPGSPLTLVSGTGPVTDTSMSSANAGQTIFYFIQAQNNFGLGTATMQALQIPPNAPVTTAPSSTSSVITVNWSPPVPAGENISLYSIYRSQLPAGPLTVFQNTVPFGTNTFNDPTAASGVTYYYNITATNPGFGSTIVGGESLKSANVTIGLSPQTPTGFAAVTIDSSNDISVTWINVLGANPNASSVSLLVSNSNVPASATTVNVTPTSAVSFFDNGVFNAAVTGEASDTTYYYWLETTNPFGTSALAGPVNQLTYPAPVNLVSVTLDPDGTSRDLTWTPVGGADVTQYNIYREQLGASSFVSVGFVPASGLTFPVKRTSPILPGKQYIYKITAVNATGEGISANAVTIGIAPSAPSSVTAVSGISNAVTQVNLSWSDPSTVSESVTAFSVYRSTSNATTALYGAPLATGITTLNYTDSPMPSTGTYYYIVAADDVDGFESKLNTVNAVAVTAFALPNPATGVTAIAGTGQDSVSWVAPATNTSYPIASFNVFRVSGGVTQAASPASTAAVFITDTGLTNGNSYSYLVQTVDTNGNLSPLSALSTSVQPVAVPGAPSPVNIGIGNNALQLTWGVGTPGTLPIGSYLIFRQQVPGAFAPLTQVSSLAYVDTGLTNTVTYNYYIESVDNTGVTTGIHVSSASSTVSGVPGTVAANPPGNVAATGGNASIAVTWTDSFVAGASVTGYQIWKSISGAAYADIVTIGAGIQNYTDNAVTNGGTYAYYLNAMNNTGVISVNSAAVTAFPAAPPAAPTPIVPADGINQVALSWTASPPVGAVTIKQYNLTQQILPGAAAPLASVAGSVTAYTDSPLSAGNTVIYTIAAVNSNGTTGVASTPVTGYPYASFTPTGFVSSASANAVTFNYSPPGSPSWPVTQYNLVRTTLSGGSPVTITSNSASVTDTTATQDQLYIYTLTATDNKGDTSGAAGPVTDGPANPPSAPATLISTAGDQQILLDWPASAPATGSLPVSEYQIIRTDAGVPVTFITTQTWFLDTTAPNGAPQTYTVQAVDETGQLSGVHISVVAGPVSATGATANLNPPTGLTAKAVNSKAVSLTWTLPNDMGKIIDAFNVYRSSSFSGTYSQIATVANPPLAPATTYVDNGLSPNTTYYYVVRAHYSSPFPPTESPNSNHATDTTPNPPTKTPPVTVSQMAFDANLLKPMTGQKLGIYYITPNTGGVEIDIYNISGNVIKYLYPGVAAANTQTITLWDGTDRNGNVVASGLYFVEIKAPGFHQVKKVAVVK